jgi:Tfp pilus assembly protein PilF
VTHGVLLLVAVLTSAAADQPSPGQPTLSERYLARAIGFLESGQLGRARVALEQAIRHDPASAQAHYLLGRLDEQKLDWDAAAKSYEETLRHAPKMAEAHDRLAIVRGEQGRTAEAIAEFEQAATLRPDLFAVRYHIGALRRLGELLEQRGDCDGAATASAEADRLEKKADGQDLPDQG